MCWVLWCTKVLNFANVYLGHPRWLSGKKSACRRCKFNPWVGRPPEEGNGNSFQYSYLGIPRSEEPGGLQSIGSELDMTKWLSMHTNTLLSEQGYFSLCFWEVFQLSNSLATLKLYIYTYIYFQEFFSLCYSFFIYSALFHE